MSMPEFELPDAKTPSRKSGTSCILRRPFSILLRYAHTTNSAAPAWMAAIGPIAATIGGIVFGERGSLLTFGTVPMSAGTAVQAGVLEYVLNLVGVYALAMAIDVIGGSVGAQRNRVQALKVAAYASTP